MINLYVDEFDGLRRILDCGSLAFNPSNAQSNVFRRSVERVLVVMMILSVTVAFISSMILNMTNLECVS